MYEGETVRDSMKVVQDALLVEIKKLELKIEKLEVQKTRADAQASFAWNIATHFLCEENAHAPDKNVALARHFDYMHDLQYSRLSPEKFWVNIAAFAVLDSISLNPDDKYIEDIAKDFEVDSKAILTEIEDATADWVFVKK